MGATSKWYQDNGYSKSYGDKKEAEANAKKKKTVSTPPTRVYGPTKSTSSTRSSSSSSRSSNTNTSSKNATYEGQTFTKDYVDKLKSWASNPTKALEELNRTKAIISSGKTTQDALSHYQRMVRIVSGKSSTGSGASNASLIGATGGTGQLDAVSETVAEYEERKWWEKYEIITAGNETPVLDFIIGSDEVGAVDGGVVGGVKGVGDTVNNIADSVGNFAMNGQSTMLVVGGLVGVFALKVLFD